MTQMFDKDPQPKPRTPWYSGLRNSFLTGIVVIAPVGLTVWLIWTVIGWVDGFVLPFVPDSYQPEALIKRVLGPETEVNIRGLGVIFFLFFTTLIGPEKLSAYECGFEPFEDSRMEFDVRFYLVAILFIIFDLEIAFLFPWAISLGNIGILGFSSMMIFLFILTIGFIYEWKKGALDWE